MLIDAEPGWICKGSSKGVTTLRNCVEASADTFIKLEKLKPKRVRGFRGGEYKHLGIHYWVEVNGYVFDTSNNQQIIAPIDEYYQKFRLFNIEYSSKGWF